MADTAETKTAAVMRLALQGDELLFTATSDDGHVRQRSASIDSVRTTLEQGALSGARVEMAIYQVEDLIMPILRELPVCKVLHVTGADFLPLMPLLDDQTQIEIKLETVEYLFNQLADYAGGSAVTWSHTVTAEELALALLLVRETMHHGGIKSLSF